ncbi:unnamed protein product, partial [Mesorhabditis spiculigera]
MLARNLPPEILHQILSYVDPKTYFKMAYTCKYNWKAATIRSKSWDYRVIFRQDSVTMVHADADRDLPMIHIEGTDCLKVLFTNATVHTVVCHWPRLFPGTKAKNVELTQGFAQPHLLLMLVAALKPPGKFDSIRVSQYDDPSPDFIEYVNENSKGFVADMVVNCWKYHEINTESIEFRADPTAWPTWESPSRFIEAWRYGDRDFRRCRFVGWSPAVVWHVLSKLEDLDARQQARQGNGRRDGEPCSAPMIRAGRVNADSVIEFDTTKTILKIVMEDLGVAQASY